MNWKIALCKLLIILGIIVITCLGQCNLWAWGLRTGAIVILTLLFIFMPLICKKYVKEEQKPAKEEFQSLNDRITNLELEVHSIKELNKKLEEEKKNLEATIRGMNKANNIDLFYDFLLLKWAKDNGAPFTEDSFNSIKEEFNKSINKE